MVSGKFRSYSLGEIIPLTRKRAPNYKIILAT